MFSRHCFFFTVALMGRQFHQGKRKIKLELIELEIMGLSLAEDTVKFNFFLLEMIGNQVIYMDRILIMMQSDVSLQ